MDLSRSSPRRATTVRSAWNWRPSVPTTWTSWRWSSAAWPGCANTFVRRRRPARARSRDALVEGVAADRGLVHGDAEAGGIAHGDDAVDHLDRIGHQLVLHRTGLRLQLEHEDVVGGCGQV